MEKKERGSERRVGAGGAYAIRNVGRNKMTANIRSVASGAHSTDELQSRRQGYRRHGQIIEEATCCRDKQQRRFRSDCSGQHRYRRIPFL
jgi:hypothetical protein